MKKSLTLIAVTVFLLAACKRESLTDKKIEATDNSSVLSEDMLSENGNNPDELYASAAASTARNNGSHYVYIESNEAAKNTILVFKQQNDGRLHLEYQVASGGKGLGAGLASQGALALDKRNDYLFAVNAGSNSVSSFRVKNNGGLELLCTVPTGGQKPVSVTVHDNYVYVLNNGSSDIMGFKLTGNGILNPINGSHQGLSSSTADAAQISFSPSGDALLISEKATNKITAFKVSGNGVAHNKVVNNSVGNTPFGFDFARGQYMIVSNADGGTPATSSCTSYKNLDYLHINAVNGKVNNGQTAVCWVATTSFGRYAFVTNTGSNTISAYYIDQSGRLYLVPWVNEQAGEKPADIIVSSDNEYVYNINGGNNTLGEYKRKSSSKLENIGYISSIPDFSAGLVSN